MSEDPDGQDDARHERARRRLRGFGYHLIGYIAVALALAVVNFLTTPQTPWFLFPMVGWGAPLALHAAWAMGLMDALFGRK